MKRKDGKPNEPGQGRPKRLNSSRHNILIDDEVWEWLKSQGEASETIEKLVREKKETFNSSNIERIFRYRILQDWLAMHGQIERLETERDELQTWKEQAINLYPHLERME